VTNPYVDGLLIQPYVTVAEFKAAPTWLDVDDLISGGVQSQQDAELSNVLLRASKWADNFCAQRLGAHTVNEQFRARVDRMGRVILHPSNVPVRQITALGFGADFQNLQPLTDFTQVWIEDARGIVVSAIPWRGSFTGALEFGMVPIQGSEIYVQIQYVAGYASTVLGATVTAPGSTLTVADPTGFQAPTATPYGLTVTLPGSTARIWDPANEEAVTVASIAGSTLTLASPTAFTHTVAAGPAGQVGISELPAEIHQAIISFAVALMLREDTAGEEPFSGTPFGPSARRSASGGKAGGLLDNAYELLEPYRRVR
jgi:hypothetical protein